MTTTPYQQLLELVREAHLLGSTQGLLDWDQQTMLPAGGLAFRAQQLKQLAQLVHQMATRPAIADLLSQCEEDASLVADPHSDTAANLREVRRSYDRATRLSQGLVAEIAETQSLAQSAWAQARSDDDFSSFQGWLEKMVTLMREKARCLAEPGQEEWDVLADDYEPGVRARDLSALFPQLQAALTPLLQELSTSGQPPERRFHDHAASQHAQEAWVRSVADAMGFDFGRGRLDRSTHPFCSGSHRGDVRLTTRFGDAFVVDALGSTMH